MDFVADVDVNVLGPGIENDPHRAGVPIFLLKSRSPTPSPSASDSHFQRAPPVFLWLTRGTTAPPLEPPETRAAALNIAAGLPLPIHALTHGWSAVGRYAHARNSSSCATNVRVTLNSGSAVDGRDGRSA